MTTIDTHPESAAAVASRPGVVLEVLDWAVTADHKRIGRLFVGFGLLGLLGALVIGALAGAERAIDPATFDIFKASTEGQVVTLQRLLLVYGAVVPVLLGLAVAIVPLQLGARALAFPRVALAGFYSWFAGVILAIVALTNKGGPAGTDRRFTGLFLTSTAMIALGLLAAALTVATSVLTTRTPGMSLLRIPAFSWASLIGAVGLLLTLPVLIGDIIYLFVDYRNGQQAAFGGSEGLMTWAGWAFTQPQVFAVVIPAVGIFAELVAVTARVRQPMRPILLTGIGLLSVDVIAATAQVQITLPWIDEKWGQRIERLLPFAFFNGLPLLGFLMVLGMAGLALKSGTPRIIAPTLFAAFGLLLVAAGGAGLGVQNIENTNLIGTSWEDGTSTATILGAALITLGGIAYWGPKLWGRRMPDAPLFGLALLGAGAAALAAAPMMIAGFAKQRGGALAGFDYDGPMELWNWLSAIGFAGVGVVVLLFAALALKSFSGGPNVGNDPWEAQTLEWATTSPPPEHNFAELYAVSSAEPLLDLPGTKGGEG
jgi:heme/copper-type cytochrome/quinol oxidase subunit 1